MLPAPYSTPLSMPSRLLCCFGLLLCCVVSIRGAQADYPIEVIELKARTLDEVLPVVRPLVSGDAAVTGMGNNLIIKASPAQVEAVRKVLAEIDRPPKRLLITVSDQGEGSGRSSGYAGSADIKIGQGQFGINSPGRRVGAAARIDTQRVGTTVRARLGEWVDLGGIDTIESGSQTGPAYANRNRKLASQQIRVKVECLDCQLR